MSHTVFLFSNADHHNYELEERRRANKVEHSEICLAWRGKFSLLLKIIKKGKEGNDKNTLEPEKENCFEIL